MIITDKNITDLITLLEGINEANEAYSGQVWWRGHAAYEWKLLPRIFRENKDLRTEQEIYLRFRRKAQARYLGCPPLDEKNLYRWLYLMQHYRLPTRLLDWTESPLSALFFVVYEKKYVNDDGAIFALDPYALNRALTNNIENNIDRNIEIYIEEMDRAKNVIYSAFTEQATRNGEIIALYPSEIDIRMAVQLSRFTVHDSEIPLDNIPKSDWVRKYKIPAGKKGELKEKLKNLGIRESILFPDLEHLSHELKEINLKPSLKNPLQFNTVTSPNPSDNQISSYPASQSTGINTHR